MFPPIRQRLLHVTGRRTLASLAHSQAQYTLPGAIRPSALEIKSQKLESRNLEAAVRHIHQDGLVVIEDVVSHADLDQLNDKMVSDARVLQARDEDGPFNYNQGNLQLDAPPVAEYFAPSIFMSSYLPPFLLTLSLIHI